MSDFMDTTPGQQLPESPQETAGTIENSELSAEQFADLVSELVSGLGKVVRDMRIHTPLGIGLLENQSVVVVLARKADDPATVAAFCQTFTVEGKTVQTFLIDAEEGAGAGNGEAAP